MPAQIKKALISVSNKEGIVEFAKKLQELDVEIISTGGTANLLIENNIHVTKVSDVTNFPEIMDGRVKTLHPSIHGGLLAVRDNKAHTEEAMENNIEHIDLLVSNLYPFEKTITSHSNFEECIEQIDIGGPAMVRAGAKNHKFVTVLTDVEDYSKVLEEMHENNNSTTLKLRKRLAQKAFARTAEYDTIISKWLKNNV